VVYPRLSRTMSDMAGGCLRRIDGAPSSEELWPGIYSASQSKGGLAPVMITLEAGEALGTTPAPFLEPSTEQHGQSAGVEVLLGGVRRQRQRLSHQGRTGEVRLPGKIELEL
jgi:hypothetical protein